MVSKFDISKEDILHFMVCVCAELHGPRKQQCVVNRRMGSVYLQIMKGDKGLIESCVLLITKGKVTNVYIAIKHKRLNCAVMQFKIDIKYYKKVVQHSVLNSPSFDSS